MNDAAYEATKLRVEQMCDKWYTALGLGWWIVTYNWRRDTLNYNETGAHLSDAATTRTQWPYRKADIDWNLDVIEGMNDEELELLVIHEFAHILIDALRSQVSEKHRDLMEYTTESVARAILYVRQAGREDAKIDPLPRPPWID